MNHHRHHSGGSLGAGGRPLPEGEARNPGHQRDRPARNAARPWNTYGALAVTALVLLMVLAFGGVYPAWYLPVDVLLVLLALAVLWLPGMHLTWLDAAVLLLLLLPCAQLALGTTVDRAATETWLLHWVAAASVYLIARRTLRLDFTARILAAFGGLLALEAIAQQFLTPGYVYGLVLYTYASPMGPFVNRDDFAGCMVLLLPFALFLAVHRRRTGHQRERWQGLWWGLAAAMMVGAVLISASRGGTLVVALEMIVFLGWQYRHSRRAAGRLAVAALVVVLLAVGYAAGFQTVLRRFQTTKVGANARLSFDRSSLKMGAARPLLGWGLGSWKDVYPQFAQLDLGLPVVNAHDDWAQMFAETGLAGLAAVALIGAAMLLNARAALRRQPALAPAAALALTGLCLHSTVEFVFHIPALLLLFALIGGALSRASESERRPHIAAAVALSSHA